MRFCPVCQTKYDEEIIKFCTKDGTPLITENPSFTAMPSESSTDDIGEETLITGYKPNIPLPIPESDEPAQRIIIPTIEEKKQGVRPLDNPQHQQQPPPKSNTALVVFLTIFGTIIVLGGGVGIWLFLRGQSANDANSNKNSNANMAVNSNYNVNANVNIALPTPTNANTNANANANVNTNTNVNTKTPTPTKSPTPSPTPSVDENLNINANTIVNISPSNTNNSNTPKPANTATPTPKPSATPTTPPQNVNVGIMNNRATSLPKPAYPPMAKQMNASGEVSVQVSIDEEGNVLAAKAVSGPLVLRASAEFAARQSRFIPVKMGDRAVRANGILVYNFINQ